MKGRQAGFEIRMLGKVLVFVLWGDMKSEIKWFKLTVICLIRDHRQSGDNYWQNFKFAITMINGLDLIHDNNLHLVRYRCIKREGRWDWLKFQDQRDVTTSNLWATFGASDISF